MPDIRHRVGVYAPQQQVYDTVRTPEGVSKWWMPARGDGEHALEFGDQDEPVLTTRVTELVPGRRVRWECVTGPGEWVGTTITFDFSPGPAAGETVVNFTHADWREPVEFMHHCSTRWGQFLFSLKNGLEHGGWQPVADMPRASSWN
ncbi:SRPBCC family protein [Nocardia stercoris]|uniref:SRPBCC domain-containing protein n=1 Tax=Nocardia stercoris TaxID=2483361 RepID=A0A3M2LF47_9NOCA|nr:SRPBCC domain-containing protein [Nocardia stercoris]RMI33298.1 SRPBCC domain-containing protein [Nocardia stercoris]